MKPIVIILKGSVSKRSVNMLEESGYIVVETSDIESIRIMHPIEQISFDPIVQALAQSITGNHSSSERDKFALALLSKIIRPQGPK